MISKRPFVVAIVGGSGSGKSWLAGELARRLRGQVARLALDDFYRDRSHLSMARRAKINFDHPSAIDWDEFQKVLAALVRGRVTLSPIYDFTTHTRKKRRRRIDPKPIILVEGLWLLSRRKIRKQFNLRIFLECSRAVRLRRRLARDLKVRGRSRSAILEQFRTTVEPMHSAFVQPQRPWSDVVLPANLANSEVKQLAGRVRRARRDGLSRPG